jgi:hypothetical protein
MTKTRVWDFSLGNGMPIELASVFEMFVGGDIRSIEVFR